MEEIVLTQVSASSKREKWNARYAAIESPGLPAYVLSENADLLPEQGRALDIACGAGANSILMAQHGLTVDAWDVSDVAITWLKDHSRGLSISPAQLDITADAFEPASYDVIVNCHYLDRSLVPAIKKALKPGGRVFFQTFTADKVVSHGPSNPEMLLAPGELYEWFGDMAELFYQDEGANPDDSHRLAGRACIVAEK